MYALLLTLSLLAVFWGLIWILIKMTRQSQEAIDDAKSSEKAIKDVKDANKVAADVDRMSDGDALKRLLGKWSRE